MSVAQMASNTQINFFTKRQPGNRSRKGHDSSRQDSNRAGDSKNSFAQLESGQDVRTALFPGICNSSAKVSSDWSMDNAQSRDRTNNQPSINRLMLGKLFETPRFPNSRNSERMHKSQIIRHPRRKVSSHPSTPSAEKKNAKSFQIEAFEFFRKNQKPSKVKQTPKLWTLADSGIQSKADSKVRFEEASIGNNSEFGITFNKEEDAEKMIFEVPSERKHDQRLQDQYQLMGQTRQLFMKKSDRKMDSSNLKNENRLNLLNYGKLPFGNLKKNSLKNDSGVMMASRTEWAQSTPKNGRNLQSMPQKDRALVEQQDSPNSKIFSSLKIQKKVPGQSLDHRVSINSKLGIDVKLRLIRVQTPEKKSKDRKAKYLELRSNLGKNSDDYRSSSYFLKSHEVQKGQLLPVTQSLNRSINLEVSLAKESLLLLKKQDQKELDILNMRRNAGGEHQIDNLKNTTPFSQNLRIPVDKGRSKSHQLNDPKNANSSQLSKFRPDQTSPKQNLDQSKSIQKVSNQPLIPLNIKLQHRIGAKSQPLSRIQ